MGLFSSHKDKAENKQTQEIKQATISDSQKSNIDTAQTQEQPQQDANFTNPFSNPQQTQTMQTQEQPQQINKPNLEQPQTQEQPQQMQTTFNTNSAEFNMESSTPQSNQQEMSQANLNLEVHKEELGKEEITEMIDETVEKLIEEKWNSLMDNVNKIVKWKEKTEADISMLKEDLVNISEGFNKLENKLISKISNYDKDILDVNSEIKALEKVFQKITPTLINNVNELSKIADDFRGIKSSNKNKLPQESIQEETSE